MVSAERVAADHGVGGTSLQMIADAVGVTKAAVYRLLALPRSESSR